MVNEEFSRQTGYDAEEAIGSNCRFLQGEDTSEEKVARLREAIDAGDSVQVTLRNYRKDGELFWNEISLSPIEQNGTIPNYVGYQQDRTNEVEYERQLEDQRNDLRLLGQMVRHDIRNDLQVMLAQFGILEEHITEEGEERLRTAEERADHAVELTTMARELTELMLGDEQGQKPITLTDSLDTQIAEVRSIFETAIIERNDPIPDVAVMADDMLGSVFRNILKNAIQHNTADVPEVTVSAITEDDIVRVRIADNGPGISDAQKEDIFGKGEMGEESAGTGIGTYLIETLLARYGGEVWIEDNEPEGAVFVIELPIAE
jgi:PAS domain S-box-containing protein